MKKFMLLHGVNHNMFGKRNPEQYGTITLDEINGRVMALADELNVSVTWSTRSMRHIWKNMTAF